MSDLIRRQDAIAVLSILADKMDSTGKTVMEQAIEVIRDLRSAQKTGEPLKISKTVNREEFENIIKNSPMMLITPGTEKIELIREQQWIPCSERLPEEEGVYPVVINGTEPVLSVKYEQGFAMGYYAPIDEAWEIDGHEESIHDLEVLAWFELPSYEENES